MAAAVGCSHRSPSDALGKVEVQAAETQRRPSASMVERSPATVTKPVRALGTAVHDLTTERHEPDKPRGLRPDLWGTAGEIPAVYPAQTEDRDGESLRF